MELSFLNVMVYVVPALAAAFFLIRRSDTHSDDKFIGHKMYRNYRKSRMDKPVM
jgi:hypothetical protein